MSKKCLQPILINLPNDMLAVILGKVGESSALDFVSSLTSCKAFCRISKFPDVWKNLNLTEVFPPQWNKIPKNFKFLVEYAKKGNVHAIFLSGLIDYYFRKEIATSIAQISYVARANHSEAMYVYGIILIGEGKIDERSNYITQLWKNQGFQAVRQCQENCGEVILELNVRQYREYDMLLTQIKVDDECVVGDFDHVCDGCFIYKEIFRFLDYVH